MNSILARFVTLGIVITLATTSAQNSPLYPTIADMTHATPSAISFFGSLFTAKSRHNVAETMQHFSPNLATYTDTTSGVALDGFEALKNLYATYMPNWGKGRSYPTRILGDLAGGNGSALVAFTNTPELFGGEVRVLGAVDVRRGKIVRWVDYWDSSSFDDATYASFNSDLSSVSYKEKQVGVDASRKLEHAAEQLSQAFARGDVQAAAGLSGRRLRT